MAIKGILFDLYGTLIDIETDESLEEIYRGISHYLTYHGIYLHRWEVRDRYYEIMKQQKEEGGEEYPEIDVEAIWNSFLRQEGIGAPLARRKLALILAQIYRGNLPETSPALPRREEGAGRAAPHLPHGSCFRRAALLRPARDEGRRTGGLFRPYHHLRELRIQETRYEAYRKGPGHYEAPAGRGDLRGQRHVPGYLRGESARHQDHLRRLQPGSQIS